MFFRRHEGLSKFSLAVSQSRFRLFLLVWRSFPNISWVLLRDGDGAFTPWISVPTCSRPLLSGHVPSLAPSLSNASRKSHVVDACGKAGRQREALALLAQMRDEGVQADTVVYNAAIDACSIAVDWEAALQLLLEMKDGVAAAAAAAAATATATAAPASTPAADATGARGLRGKTGVAAAPPPDVVSYSSAITACARAKRVDEALDLLSELRFNEAQVAAAAVRDGRGGGGGPRVGFPVPNLVAYSAGLFACLKAGDVARGAELLDEMIAAGLQPNKIHCDTMVAA